jgi:hypothetical protein
MKRQRKWVIKVTDDNKRKKNVRRETGGTFCWRGEQGCQMVCFQTKNPNLGKFWRVLHWKMLRSLMAIWNMLRSFGKFYDHLVHFVLIWYIFSGFGITYQQKSGNPDCECQVFRLMWLKKSKLFLKQFQISRIVRTRIRFTIGEKRIPTLKKSRKWKENEKKSSSDFFLRIWFQVLTRIFSSV